MTNKIADSIPLGIQNNMSNCYINCALQLLLNLPGLNHQLLEFFQRKTGPGPLHEKLEKSSDIEWLLFYLNLLDNMTMEQRSQVRRKVLNINHFYQFLCKIGEARMNHQGDYHEFFLSLSDHLSKAQKQLGLKPTFDDLITGELTKNICCQRCQNVVKVTDLFSSVPLIDNKVVASLLALQEQTILNDYSCEKCGNGEKTDASITVQIKTLPSLLIFHCLCKTRTPIKFDRGYKIQTEEKKLTYLSYATVHHCGSQFGGHYYVQLFVDDKIYMINDEHVSLQNTIENWNIVSLLLLRN